MSTESLKKTLEEQENLTLKTGPWMSDADSCLIRKHCKHLDLTSGLNVLKWRRNLRCGSGVDVFLMLDINWLFSDVALLSGPFLCSSEQMKEHRELSASSLLQEFNRNDPILRRSHDGKLNVSLRWWNIRGVKAQLNLRRLIPPQLLF